MEEDLNDIIKETFDDDTLTSYNNSISGYVDGGYTSCSGFSVTDFDINKLEDQLGQIVNSSKYDDKVEDELAERIVKKIIDEDEVTPYVKRILIDYAEKILEDTSEIFKETIERKNKEIDDLKDKLDSLEKRLDYLEKREDVVSVGGGGSGLGLNPWRGSEIYYTTSTSTGDNIIIDCGSSIKDNLGSVNIY